MIRKALTVGALVVSGMFAASGLALADDAQYYVSGYDGPGLVTRTTAHNNRCGGGPSIYVQNNSTTAPTSAHFNSGKRGAGTVCITKAGADANKWGAWWDGPANGPRG